MAKSLNDTLAFVQGFVFNKPLALGTANEPAISMANTVKQTILSAPFAWRWNRNTATFTCTLAQQNYSQACADFGWIEKASVQDIPSGKWFEMKPMLALALDSASARPQHVAAWGDDGAGNITFRTMPVADKAYPVSITWQKKAAAFATLTDTWSPIPDEMSYIYSWGFLALTFLYSDDPRFGMANQKFMSSLLAASEGLDETQRNIFIANWQAMSQAVDATTLRQGSMARGV